VLKVEKPRTEISSELLRAVRQLARRQGRAESEVVDEAVLRYLDFVLYWQSGEAEAERRASRDDFRALLDRMSSRFDLDPDEAMRIAVEEQHAFRQERAERERERERR
jgi:hypothetical protein